jgi:hypothetical protein
MVHKTTRLMLALLIAGSAFGQEKFFEIRSGALEPPIVEIREFVGGKQFSIVATYDKSKAFPRMGKRTNQVYGRGYAFFRLDSLMTDSTLLALCGQRTISLTPSDKAGFLVRVLEEKKPETSIELTTDSTLIEAKAYTDRAVAEHAKVQSEQNSRLHAIENNYGRDIALYAIIAGTYQTSRRPQGYGVGAALVAKSNVWRGFAETEFGGSNTRGVQGGFQFGMGLQYKAAQELYVGGTIRAMTHKDSLTFKPIWQAGAGVAATYSKGYWDLTVSVMPMWSWSFEQELTQYGTRGGAFAAALGISYRIVTPF